jgi:mannose-1-phosphate guanylyltransferase/mannose-1-phosphate guanylyltransferase/mannose-6-phosphate isomerase
MHGDEALMLVMPSDHAIDDLDRFDQAVELGRRAAAADKLVTFGIHPATPETGYGYIETGPEIPQVPGVHEVARFVEKPALAEAEAMVADGNHLWNAGIFLFKVGTILSEFDKFEPEIRGCAERSIELAERNGIAILAKRAEFERCPSDSIDYAVMERSASIAVVPMSPGWSDVGSWDAIAQMQTANAPGDLITALDCTGCYIRSDGLKVAALGLKDLIVVVSGEGLLILPRGRSQEVKKLLSAMDTTAA